MSFWANVFLGKSLSLVDSVFIYEQNLHVWPDFAHVTAMTDHNFGYDQTIWAISMDQHDQNRDLCQNYTVSMN
jgi:hypothetical protein